MLHYFPLEHIPNRYTIHLDEDIQEYLNRKGIEYIYYEPKTPEVEKEVDGKNFLNAVETVYRQNYQMTKFLENWSKGLVNDGDVVFVSDLWSFSVAAFKYLQFFTGKKIEVRGLFHAGAFTDSDFVHQMERTYHGFEETLIDCCDKIYLASEFFKRDFISKRFVDDGKIEVVPLPMDFKRLEKWKSKNIKKENIVLFNGRHAPEKHPELFELLKKLRPEYEYIDTGLGLSKEEYFEALCRAKVVISFADGENFGYGIQEGTYLGCVPIVPNRLCYVEQFDKKYLYDNFVEAVEKVDAAMKGELTSAQPYHTSNEKTFETWFKSL